MPQSCKARSRSEQNAALRKDGSLTIWYDPDILCRAFARRRVRVALLPAADLHIELGEQDARDWAGPNRNLAECLQRRSPASLEHSVKLTQPSIWQDVVRLPGRSLRPLAPSRGSHPAPWSTPTTTCHGGRTGGSFHRNAIHPRHGNGRHAILSQRGSCTWRPIAWMWRCILEPRGPCS